MQEYKTLSDIVKQLEMSEYECEGGYLKNNTAFIKLKEIAENVSVPLDALVMLNFADIQKEFESKFWHLDSDHKKVYSMYSIAEIWEWFEQKLKGTGKISA